MSLIKAQKITVGEEINSSEIKNRDEVHIAVIPAFSKDPVLPGEQVFFKSYSKGEYGDIVEVASYGDDDYIGVVDPFLNGDFGIDSNTKFWLFLRPGLTFELRHAWESELFQEKDNDNTEGKDEFSENFTRDLILDNNFCDTTINNKKDESLDAYTDSDACPSWMCEDEENTEEEADDKWQKGFYVTQKFTLEDFAKNILKLEWYEFQSILKSDNPNFVPEVDECDIDPCCPYLEDLSADIDFYYFGVDVDPCCPYVDDVESEIIDPIKNKRQKLIFDNIDAIQKECNNQGWEISDYFLNR